MINPWNLFPLPLALRMVGPSYRENNDSRAGWIGIEEKSATVRLVEAITSIQLRVTAQKAVAPWKVSVR